MRSKDLLLSLCLAAISHASPLFTSLPEFALVDRDLLANDTTQVLDAEGLHEAALQNHPSNLIISSRQLGEYMDTHSDSADVVYLRDTREWVKLEPEIRSLHPRVGGAECMPSNSPRVKVTIAATLMYPWQPVSECMPYGTISQGKGWEYSISYSASIGLDFAWDAIATALGASFGVEVSRSTSEQITQECGAPEEGGQAQIWGRKKMTWSEMQISYYDRCTHETSEAQTVWAATPLQVQTGTRSRCQKDTSETDVNCDCGAA